MSPAVAVAACASSQTPQTHARGAELEHALELGDRGKVDPALVALAHKALEELVTRKVAVAEVELRGGTDTEGGTEGDAWGVGAWVCVGSARANADVRAQAVVAAQAIIIELQRPTAQRLPHSIVGIKHGG